MVKSVAELNAAMASDDAMIAILKERALSYVRAEAAQIRCGPRGKGEKTTVDGPLWARIRPVSTMWLLAQADEGCKRAKEFRQCHVALGNLSAEYGTERHDQLFKEAKAEQSLAIRALLLADDAVKIYSQKLEDLGVDVLAG